MDHDCLTHMFHKLELNCIFYWIDVCAKNSRPNEKIGLNYVIRESFYFAAKMYLSDSSKVRG